MKKILFALLIAVIFCKTELDALNLENVLDQNWQTVKNDFNSAVEFLKVYIVFDPLVTFIKNNLF